MYGALIVLFLYMGSYAALYRVSDYTVLQQQANSLLSNSQRRITFDSDIGRRVFPRPTIILRNVVLTEQDGKTPALSIGELRLGVAWSSLWGERTIEKLVADKFSGSLSRNAAGQWNIGDIWNLRSENQSLKINRLIIGDGKLQLNIGDNTLHLQQIDFSSQRNGEHFNYSLKVNIQHPQWDELTANAQGQAQIQAKRFILPNAHIRFSGKENGYDFSGSLKTQAMWQPQNFNAKQTQIELSSNRFDTHISTNIERIENQKGNAKLSNINSTYRFNDGQQEYTGSFNAPQVAWVSNILSSEAIGIALSMQTSESDKLNITLHGGGTWRANDGARLSKVKMTSLQTIAGNQTRFASEWEANLHIQNKQSWAIQAQGMFDRQPAELALTRAAEQISGKIMLTKLDLSNYIDPKQNNTLSYPTFPENQLQFQIGVSLGTLKLPSLEIHNFQTQMHANAQKTELSSLSAELYGGSSSGSLSIENTIPPTLKLKQDSQNVQIQPLMQDLFSISRISGQGQAQLDLSSQGSNRQELIANLSGSLNFNVQNGQWLGINFAQLAKSALGSENGYSDPNAQAQTPFSQFSLTSTIEQGVSKHKLNAQLTQPVAALSSEGETNFNTGEIRDDVVIRAATAPDLPIRFSGKIDNPSISLNYQKLTSASQTPEEKQKAISDTLKQQWLWLKQEQQ